MGGLRPRLQGFDSLAAHSTEPNTYRQDKIMSNLVSQMDAALENMGHLAHHIEHDACNRRELLGNSSRGMEGQISVALEWLASQSADLSDIREIPGINSDTLVVDWEAISDDDASWLPDLIEATELVIWEDGDLWILGECDADYVSGKDTLELVTDSFLSVECFRSTDENNGSRIIRAAITLGGPNIYLIRDEFYSDHLAGFWWTDKAKRYGPALETVLDYLEGVYEYL